MASLSEAFGKRIRGLRKAQGLTQEALGERADLHPTYIGAIERGEQSPSLDTIEKLSRGLGVELRTLLNFKTLTIEGSVAGSLNQRMAHLLRGRPTHEVRLGLNVLENVFRWTKQIRLDSPRKK